MPNSVKSSGSIDAIGLAARPVGASELEVDLSVPDLRCASCIQKVEKRLMATPGVTQARVNLTARRVRIRWNASDTVPPLIDAIEQAGFDAQLTDVDGEQMHDDELAKHIRALAIAGFAAGNVMMLSWSVWSGADDSTRHLFHVLSALIAVPALIFSSRVFFTSAYSALRHGTTNMDVPICVGIVLTTLLSIYDTVARGHQVYFDAAIMLVFFLLIGRTLDVRMRAKARDAMSSLKQMQATIAQVLRPDIENPTPTPIEQVQQGDLLRVDTSERIPVDCRVVSGESTVDMAIVTGESVPVSVAQGVTLSAGCLNLDGELIVKAVEDIHGSFLSRVEREIIQAEQHKGRYHQLADRVVHYYTPLVHIAALLALLAWISHTGDWYQSITVGIAVLIITCPCALGLAVPIARVIAAQQLMRRGVLMKNGQALEQLAQVDTAVFDKTGTLTTTNASLDCSDSYFDGHTLAIAKTLASASEHPYARAIVAAEHHDVAVQPSPFDADMHPDTASMPENSSNGFPSYNSADIHMDVINCVAGAGVQGQCGEDVYRLGSERWAMYDNSNDKNLPMPSESSGKPGSVLTCNGQRIAHFSFTDTLRHNAALSIRQLELCGVHCAILSGDQRVPVETVSRLLSIEQFQFDASPWDKVQWIQQAQQSDQSVVMIGDGVNDSPALSAAAVSIVPGSAATMTRNMGDFVLLADALTAIPQAIHIARLSRRIVVQNLYLAVGYNIVAMPLAMGGYVTPLVAALAMSLSSALVVANSLRLTLIKFDSADVSAAENRSLSLATQTAGQKAS